METSVCLVDANATSKQNVTNRNKWLQCFAVVGMMACIMFMAFWMYQMQTDIQHLMKKVHNLEQQVQQQQISINSMKANENDIGKSSSSLVGRVNTKKRRDVCSQVHACQPAKQFESIHLSIDTDKTPPLYVLKQNAKIKEWKLKAKEDKVGGLTYNEKTGEVTVAVSGYYYVYAQLRPAQDTPKIEWFTIFILKNDTLVAATSWAYSKALTTKSLSRSLYLRKNDKISVKLPSSKENFKYFNHDNSYSFFGLYLISAK